VNMESHNRRIQAIGSHLAYQSPEHEPLQFQPSRFENKAMKVLVTGAAGQIGYAVSFLVASGAMFGPDQKVFLHLLEIEQAKKAVLGIEMELYDGAFPLLEGVLATTDPVQAFTGVEAIIMVGSFPRIKGMERKDLLSKNFAIFKNQGTLIDKHAARNVKVLVVGNPANTNCFICSKFAPSIPANQFSALTRLDQNRAVNEVARKCGVLPGDVKNVLIWGNHSTTQFPDCSHATVRVNGKEKKVTQVLEENYLNGEFIPMIQNRGAAVIAQRGSSSAQSAAQAIACHMRDWFLGTKPGEFVSMAVVSDGSYGIPKGLVFSFPVSIKDGKYEIVKNLPISNFAQEKLNITTQELEQERDTVLPWL